MTSTTAAVAESVRGLMAEQRKSNGSLAELLGISEWTASRKRAGHSPFKVDELYTVAHWLGTTTEDLVA